MHQTTTPSTHTTTPTTTPTTTTSTSPLPQILSIIDHLLPLLLLSSNSIKSFIGRWQIIRTKLTTLQTSLSPLSTSTPHPLLHQLLPSLLTTLQNLHSLSQQCQNNPTSKLLTQSNLDMASSSLSSHLENLDLLLKSGLLLRQSNAIVLAQPAPNCSKEELSFFIRDLFARLQIGGFDFKKKALESLLEILQQNDKASILVAKEGDLRYLVHLLDSNHHSSVRELATMAVSVLASASDSSRNSVFEEGGLGPLLRIIESGSLGLKEKATMAVESITSDPENAWAVSAYGGVSILIEACRSGSPVIQSHAVGSIKNIAAVEEIRVALAEEGAVEVLVQLLGCGTQSTQEKAANCLWILASASEDFRISIFEQKGLQILIQLVQESSNSDTLEHVLRAIYALLSSGTTPNILSSSTTFLLNLSGLIKHGNLTIQQLSSSILCSLSISDTNKRLLCGCMGSLVKMMESSKPMGLQESASNSLVSLLSVKSNRKEFVRDDKSVTKLVNMLDPKNELICKKFPVAVANGVLAGGSNGCRKKLLEVGAYGHLQKLLEMEVDGAKKALQRLSGNRLKKIFSRTWRE